MKKEEFIRIRVAGWQKKYISLQAEKAHKSLSQYVRDAAMDKDVTVIDGVDDLIRELRRQGNNLNQLASWRGRVMSSWSTWSRSWRCMKTHGKR